MAKRWRKIGLAMLALVPVMGLPAQHASAGQRLADVKPAVLGSSYAEPPVVGATITMSGVFGNGQLWPVTFDARPPVDDGRPFEIISDGCSGYTLQPNDTCTVTYSFTRTDARSVWLAMDQVHWSSQYNDGTEGVAL